jgi:D-alanyl-lipoteichoic acid acyltransferase DltB (MBOAT superfamily)
MIFNYGLGVLLSNKKALKVKKIILIFGIASNLALLGYFKYANFFVEQLNLVIATSYNLEKIILPLAISFFTFQQIAYLVDAHKGETKEYDFLQYCLFVSFFPQLIAGPIVHHKEMMPQFFKDTLYKVKAEHIAIGLTIFTIGLFKKVVIADEVALYATPIFSASEQGLSLSLFEAWFGALAYTLQLYFDFSGYSDMAIGIARMFGILLPLNFHSPYKSKNIIEFWRHWHMTLSKFLRDYVYIPFGGSHLGKVKRYRNLMLTMSLGGIWHGAGWPFILWGLLHGSYLIINHSWHALRKAFGQNLQGKESLLGIISARFITFIAVVFGWVLFRAESFDSATNIYMSMIGGNGLTLPSFISTYVQPYISFFNENNITFSGAIQNPELANFTDGTLTILLGLLVATILPNTQQIMSNYTPALLSETDPSINKNFKLLLWKPTFVHLVITITIFCYSIFSMSKVSEFLYFNF